MNRPSLLVFMPALVLAIVQATVLADQSVIDAGISVHFVNEPDPILQDQVEFISELIRFAKPVKVLHEVEEGPLFDPATQEIWLPGSFANVIKSYFKDEDAPVADVYFHTLMHEIGHVLYEQYDLPLLAREEDAADALARHYVVTCPSQERGLSLRWETPITEP